MKRWIVGAAALLGVAATAAPAAADEVFVGGLVHDVKVFSGSPHEGGTADVEFAYRTRRFDLLPYFTPYVYAKGEINTSGKTDFFTLGVEFRKHLFGDKFYAQAGLGITAHDGLNQYPGYTQPGLTPQQAAINLQIERQNKAFGSDVLFNPSISFGYEFSPRWSVEAVYDHYSHAKLLGQRNPGIDNFGGRIVYKFGPR